MLNGQQMFVVKRTDNPALLFDSEWVKPEDVPPLVDMIVLVGRLGRVPTFPVSKLDKAVDRRFLKLKGLRWDEKIGRWCSNGDAGRGKFVINV